jgi:hypothetical protein
MRAVDATMRAVDATMRAVALSRWEVLIPRLALCRFQEARALLGTESYLNLPFLLTLAASRLATAGVPCKATPNLTSIGI